MGLFSMFLATRPWGGACGVRLQLFTTIATLGIPYTVSAGASRQVSLLISTCSVAWWIWNRLESSVQT